MAQTTAAGGQNNEPSAAGAGVPDPPEQWGVGGMVGDGRYRLTRRLGRGGMAEVFAAEDVRLGRVVAVKLLRSDLAEDPVSKARFTREAQSVAGLNHHAVVAVYDSGEDHTPSGTVPYIVMELVEGRTIRELLTESAEPPPVDQALAIVSGVLEALAYSHQHGIVHRDIKPANVIITDTGAVKVMDFGIARALHGASSTMTQTGMVMGTPQYLSPEQALGKTVDTRSDLYATGCLLYELLALRPPFIGETPLSVVYQHVQDAPRLPSEISDRVPPELDGLVMRALAKDPDDRFQSAEEMRGILQYALAMLHQRGGHTGTWNTGAVTSTGGTTPVMGLPQQTATARLGAAGVAGVGAAAGRHTTEFGAPPLLAGQGGGGSADPTVAYRPGDRGPDGGSRWVKPVLFVLAAVLAVSLGIWLANSNTSGGKPGGGTTNQPTQSQSQPTDTTPSDQPTDTETSGTDNSTGSATQPTYGSSSSQPSPSHQPTSQTPSPSTQPTTTAPTTAEPTSPTPTPTDTGTDAAGATNGSGGSTQGAAAGTSTGGTVQGPTG
jgi:serine/threonine protein kinase